MTCFNAFYKSYSRKADIFLNVNRLQCYIIVCSCSLLTSSKVKGVNCVECKLLHCEYRAYKGVNYQTMPLQCIVFSGSTYSQSAIEVILVSNEADLRADSNDSSPMCISCKIKKLFLHRSEREHTIVLWTRLGAKELGHCIK